MDAGDGRSDRPRTPRPKRRPDLRGSFQARRGVIHWLPYGQAWAIPAIRVAVDTIAKTHYADPRLWYEAWGPEQVAREWPAGCRLQLSAKNVFYSAPPPNGAKLRATDVFVDTSLPVLLEESGFVENFRGSRWVWVGFVVEGSAVFTNVAREPNWPRENRSPMHYTNLHTQWGTKLVSLR